MVGARSISGAAGRLTAVPRSRVLERLKRAALYPVTVISAPAGYGKTVALRQYLETLDDPVIRYDVRASESTLLGFLRGLARACSGVAPDLAKTVASAYTSYASENDPQNLARWMHAHIDAYSGVVAVDDVHLALQDDAVARFLAALISVSKDRVRWILATRTASTLPVATWMAYGDMDAPIDQRDLQITLEEARGVAAVIAPHIGDAELNELLRLTGAWATALNFALHSSTRSRDLREAAAMSRDLLYHYLAEQVYAALSQEEKDLLQFASHLHDVEAAVLECGGFVRARAMLETLCARTGFVFRQRDGVYRCHDLFRDFLQEQVRLKGTAPARAIHVAVAQALEASGHRTGALEAYGALRDESQILRMLSECGFEVLDAGSTDTIRIALGGLSTETRETSAIALALQAMIETSAGEFTRAQSLLESAMNLAQDRAMRAEIGLRLASLMFELASAPFGLLERIAADEHLPARFRVRAWSFLAPSYAMHGRREEAASALAQLEAYANSAAPSALTAQVLHRAGITTVELRDTAQRADRFFLKAAKMAESLGRYYTSSAAFGGLTTCAIVYDDDMPLALNFAEKAVDAAQKAGDRHSLQRALMHAVCAAVWLGDADKIADLHRRYLEVRTADSPEYAYAIPVFALVLAWQGRFAEARRKMNELNGHDPARDYDRCFACATNAVFAAVCGERETAIDLAERAFQESFLVRALQRHESIVLDNTRSISALALAVVGRGARANAMLKHAAKCDEPAAREVRDCVAAALRALDDGVMSVELRTGLERLEPVGRRGLAMLIETALATILEDSQRHGDLTEAELRVLAALAEGSSSKEIAARSGRSVHTVRTLAQRAIEKLGCSGRHQAIAIARRRGLLPVDDPSIRWG